jgi:hypothetical protein
MGASADQIDRQIKETRERMDENLGMLEKRTKSNALRFGRIAAVVVGTVAVGAGAYLAYRRFRRPTLKDRLTSLSPDSLRALADELSSRMKEVRKAVPSISVTVNGKGEAEPGTVESIIRKVAPALIGTASTALIEKATGRTKADQEDERGSMHASPAFD